LITDPGLRCLLSGRDDDHAVVGPRYECMALVRTR
jgi:hypothetical protein